MRKASLQAVQREAWAIALKENTTNRDKLSALALCKECSQADYAITTDSTVIKEAFVLIKRNRKEEERNDNTSNRIS